MLALLVTMRHFGKTLHKGRQAHVVVARSVALADKHICEGRSSPRGRAGRHTCDGPLQAAPMQKRVLPDSLARSAAWYTSSRSSSFSALSPVSCRHALLWEQ